MADSTSEYDELEIEDITDRDRLAKAIVAAADLEFSAFKDNITSSVEARFSDRISQIAKEKAAALFNPDPPEEEDHEEEFDFEDVEVTDPNDPPTDPLDIDDPPTDTE